MKNRVLFPVAIIGVFTVGLIGGAWADWSTWVVNPSRAYNYQVEPYNQANLLVSQYDLISLQHPDGTNSGLKMNFLGSDSPCANGSGDNYCVVGAPKTGGEYLFSCDSLNGDTCPDPGIQQVPVQPPPPPPAPFPKSLLLDLKHVLLGWNPKEWEVQQFLGRALQSTASKAVVLGASAYVYCNGGPTAVFNRPVSGNPNWPNSIPTGEKILWSTHDALTLTPNGLPGLCAQPPASGPGNTWSCLAGTPSANAYSYTAKLDSCTVASQSQEIIVTVSK
jgi:hypothetical protein